MQTTRYGDIEKWINESWHDQVVDLESISYVERAGECSFDVCVSRPENDTPLVAVGRFGLFRTPLHILRAQITGVSSITVQARSDERELFVRTVVFTPKRLEVLGDNASFTVEGDALRLFEIELEDRRRKGREGRRLILPALEFTWTVRKSVERSQWDR